MPAPTARKEVVVPAEVPLPEPDIDEDLLLDVPKPDQALPSENVNASGTPSATAMVIDEESRPNFAPATDLIRASRSEKRQVRIPPHRLSPLKQNWSRIYPPLVEHLKLQTRFNPARKTVELKTSKFTTDPGALQKGEDFVKAFSLGFVVDDAIALLRLDDLYIETFEIKDVKASLHGDHLTRAIGRIAGNQGKTKFAIENTTKTRIVLADSKIHILGAHRSVNIARNTISDLILGKSPSKVYNNLRGISARMKERF